MKPLLVGEMNPYGADPDMALYPLPEHASGGRLARILGLSHGDYLRRFDRVNLCVGKWSLPLAREAAEQILKGELRATVLLGAKVMSAFGHGYAPFTRVGQLFFLPHPSGLNQIWNTPGTAERARALLAPLFTEETAS